MTCSKMLALAFALLIPIAATAETIEGEVDFTGKVPVAGKLHREADPYCAKKTMTDPAVTVKGGKLEYVWVHVTKGAKDATAPSSVVEMDQKDCMYTPRMAVAVVGQKIQAKNGDPILHNVHTYLGSSTLFNKGMPNDKVPPIEYVAKEEGMIKWKCDVHPWMRGYTGVSKSGLQAIAKDGTYKIDNGGLRPWPGLGLQASGLGLEQFVASDLGVEQSVALLEQGRTG